MAAGSIVVDLLLKTGSFETDTQRASKALKQFKKDADTIGTAIGAGLVAATAGLAYLVKSTIDADDHLNDLSKATGVAVDTLGGIGFAASQAGSSIDGVAAGLGKLNQTLGKAASGNQEATDALKALGVDAIDPLTGKTITVDKALEKLADTFHGAADSPEKFRLAQQALGKQYQELIPLLADGGKALRDNIAYYQKYAGVSADTAEKADAFNDTLTKIKLLSGAFGQTLVAELLPALQSLANLWVENKEKGDQFKGAAGDLATILKSIAFAALAGATAFVAFGKAIGGTLSAIDAAKNFRFGEALEISKETLSDLGDAKDRVSSLYDAIFNPPAASKSDKPAQSFLKGVTDTAGAAKAEADLKKLLAGQIKAIEAWATQRRDALDFANRLLDSEYQDGLVTLQNRQDDEANIRARALKVETDEQDKIIAAERAFAQRANNSADRIDAENKIAEAVEKKTRAIVKAGQEEELTQRANAREVKALQDAYENLQTSVLSLQGDDFSAAVVKNAQQVVQAIKLINQAGGDPAQANELARQLELRAELAKATKDYGATLNDLNNAEARIALAQQTGALTSLDALVKLGEERRKQIPVLESEVAAQEAIAKASGNPTLIQNATAARLALDKLKASADPLAESLNKTFGADFNSALDDFVTGTKSASQAFDSFAKSVLNDILKMGSKSIAESIFGGSGGIGGLVSSLFSSGSSSNSSGGSAASTGGLLSSIVGLFSGFHADGGFIPPGQWGVVGERGPEVAFGGKSGASIHPVSGGTTQHINVSVQGAANQSRDSALQQGAAIGLGIQRALARNT